MIKMTHVVQKKVQRSWIDLSEFATVEGAARRILKLRKRFKRNKYRVKRL